MDDSRKVRLKIPRQDLPEFALFPPNASAAAGWAQALPVADTESAVSLLSQALDDLNRTRLAPEIRYNILEALLPNLDVVLSNLSRRFLNQPLIMPTEPMRMAELGNKLYTLTSTAYTIVAIETIQQHEAIRDTNPARLTCQAIQRALMYAGGRVLQTLQLFRPLDIHAWRSLHQLYALAENQQLADLPVPEPRSGGATIKACYMQTLILGCCKPNNLRQGELEVLYGALRGWSTLAQLKPPKVGTGLFLVDLDSDQPPLYSTLHKEPGPQCRYIDTAVLTKHLKSLRAEASSGSIQVDANTSLPTSLLDQLIISLGSTSLRNFTRTTSDGELWVCTGLSSTHFHVAGERDFGQVLYGDTYLPGAVERMVGNRFMKHHSKGDMWQEANPEEDYVEQGPSPDAEQEHQVPLDAATEAELLEQEPAQLSPTDRYPIFKVRLADASPGGYCLEWSAELPGNIKSGDIIGLKESQNQDWAISVIRWISQVDSDRTLVGLELLSPRAMSYGASIRQKSGELTPPMRVLLLPEIKLVGQPNTLITPRAGFRERQKITLGNQAEKCSIQLQQQIASTGGFAQFEFRYLKELGDVLAEQADVKLSADYDSLWSRI